MKRNLRTMAVVFWVLFIVATLLIFLPARAAEEAERTEDRTETAPECTDRAIEAEPEEDFENEYIEAALYAYGNFRVGCDYLAELLGKYPLEEALTAYNSGKPGKSTYASNVLAYMEAYYGD